MKVIKKNDEFGLNVFFLENGKYINFCFGGNGDLYWTIHNKNVDLNSDYNYESFVITKENYLVYRLFEQLYHDIENIEIFDFEDDVPFYIEDDKEKLEYLENRRKQVLEDKMRYRLYNYSNYNELFDVNSKTITWYSDETAHDVSNILKIKKEGNTFKIEFYTQQYIEGYDKDFHNPGYIPIRFRNSGSSYAPFNVIFMRMYNNMQNIDDVNDIGHQIHIEEYLYSKGKTKKLSNKK